MRVLLGRADGLSIRKAAEAAGISPSRVKPITDRWKKEGFEGLKDKPRPGRKAKLAGEQIFTIQEMAQQGTPKRILARKFGVHRMTIYRRLRRATRLIGVMEAIAIEPPVKPVSRMLSAINDSSLENRLSKMMRDACNSHYQYHHRSEDEKKFNEIMACARTDSDWHLAALQAEKNIMYLSDDLETAERRAEDLYNRVDCAKRDDSRMRLIVVETHLYRARICEKRESFGDNGIFFWLDKAEQELAQLRSSEKELCVMPKEAARVGHSLVISHDCFVPASVFRAAIMHFRGKNLIRSGLDQFKREDVHCGLRLLNKAQAEDENMQAWSHLGFDLLWQVEAYSAEGETKKADRCLKKSNDYLIGAFGKGHHFLQEALLKVREFDKFKHFCDEALEAFQKCSSWIGVAAVYRNLKWTIIYNGRGRINNSDARRLVENAFLAYALEPVQRNLRELQEAARRWADRNDGFEKPISFVQKLAERVLNRECDFSVIRVLVRNEQELKALERGVTKATKIFLHQVNLDSNFNLHWKSVLKSHYTKS